MPDPYEVNVPLLNTNEPEARVVALYVTEGDRVADGVVLCMLETTKSTAEVVAEREGFVVGLQAAVGDVLRAGERLCWLAGEADWQPPEPKAVEPSEAVSVPNGLRITAPALAMARDAGLELSSLPIGPLITQAMVRQVLVVEQEAGFDLSDALHDPRALIIYGGGGHGKSLIDLVRAQGEYDIVGVVDDGLAAESTVMDLPVLGGGGELAVLAKRGVRLAANAVGGVGDVMSRIDVFRRIKDAGFACPTLIHPSAVVEPSAKLASGVQVFPHAYVGSQAEIGFGVIVNTGAVVSHDCHVAAYANIAPGALLAGGVKIGEGVLIGMGVTINLSVCVGAGARVGNSAMVKRDVPQGTIVRAGGSWPPPQQAGA
jgi:acetyltransferase EpsM